MTDDISLTLTWFASYANFYSVLSVLLCFFVMVVFILRLNGENFMSYSATRYPVVKEQSMVCLPNPFSVQLHKTKPSSLKAGLNLCLSMKKKCKVKVLWGVDVQMFQKELQVTSLEVAERYNNNNIFEGSFKHAVDCGIMSSEDECGDTYLKCPDELSEELLGEPPRMLYPAVVVTCLEECRAQPSITAIVVQFTVIHLKDSICSLDSHIVYQFVKTNNNKLLGLQPIFMSTTEADCQKDNLNVPRNGNIEDVTNTSSHSHLVSNMADKGQGQTAGSSNTGSLQHCSTCGKIRKSEEYIAATREHEKCDCHDNDLDNSERSDVNFIEETMGSEADMSGNTIYSLHDHMEEGDNVTKTNNENTEETLMQSDEMDSCCVCQSSEIFYTLLPCRHACVCSTCIRHLDKCPICRSYIEAYFRLHNKLSDQELRESRESVDDMGPRLNWWQSFNLRLNELLGFN